jgi:hypothetical protein
VAPVKTHSNALVASEGTRGSVTSYCKWAMNIQGRIEDNQDLLGSEGLCKALVKASRGPNTSGPLTPG